MLETKEDRIQNFYDSSGHTYFQKEAKENFIIKTN